MPVVSEPFAMLAMDIVGPLEQIVSGKNYILVLVDNITRYLLKQFRHVQLTLNRSLASLYVFSLERVSGKSLHGSG